MPIASEYVGACVEGFSAPIVSERVGRWGMVASLEAILCS